MPKLIHYQPQIMPQQVDLRLANVPRNVAETETGGAKILKAAFGAASDILKPVIRDYARFQTCRVSDMVQQTERKMEEWKAAYMRDNQGADASMAQRDFSAAWEKFAAEAKEEFGGSGHEIYAHQLEKQLLARGLMHFKDGGNYQQGQVKAWEKSVWDTRLAEFQKACGDSANDPDRLDYMRNELLELWKTQHKGEDAGATDLQLRQMRIKIQISSLLLNQDINGAQNALDMATGGFGKAARANGAPPDNGGTIAEDLNNPLNLKKPGALGSGRNAFEFFASVNDGFRGAANQLRRYKTHYGLSTPRQMVQRWAPASDGNNHSNYFKNMAAAGLKNIDAEIDVDDPGQMAMLLKAMATAEGPLGAKYSVEQIAGFLTENGGNAARANGSPIRAAGGWIDPAAAMQFQSKIDSMRDKEIAALKAQAKLDHSNYLAQCEDGQVQDAPNPQNYVGFGKDAQNRIMEAQAARDYGIRLDAIRRLPIVSQQSVVESMRPRAGAPDYDARSRYFSKLKAEYKNMQTAWKNEPAAWMSQYDSNVKNARMRLFSQFTPENFQQYMASLQTAYNQRGISSRELFSESDAGYLAVMIDTSPNPKQQMQTFGTVFGPAYGQAMDAIMPKASEFARIAVNMRDDSAVKILMECRKNKDFIKDTEDSTGLKGVDKTIWQEKIQEKLAPLTESLLGGLDSSMTHAVHDAVYMLSLAYKSRGMEDDAAIERASNDVILSNYSYAENKNGAGMNFRIPKNLDAGAIAKGAANFQEKADCSDYYIELDPSKDADGQRKILSEELKELSNWVTAGDESGLYLFIHHNIVRDRKTGEPVKISWQTLANWQDVEGQDAETSQVFLEDY